MFQSIFIYGFIIIALFLSFQVGITKEGNTITVTKPKQYYLFTLFGIAVFTFFSAVRWDVGIDYLSYLKTYNAISDSSIVLRDDLEVGYVFLQKLLVKLGAHFTIYFGLVAFLQLCFAILYFNKEKYLLPYFLVLIMCGGDYFFWMNGMRQALVSTCLLFVLSQTVDNKKILIFIISMFLLSYIHKSALILLPLCLLYYLPLDNVYIKKPLQFILFFSVIVLSDLSIWQYLLDIVDGAMSFIGYERFTDGTLETLEVRDMNFGVRRIIFLIIDIVIITYSDKLRQVYKSRKFGLSLLLFIVFYTFYPLFISSLVFSRIVGYFSVFRIIMVSYLLFYLFRIKNTPINYCVGLAIIMLFLMHLFIQIYADPGHHTDCIRYQFFWDYI